MKLVISDAHEGLKAAMRKVISATWQRCRVHFMRNLLVHAPKGQRGVVSALVRTIFAQTSEKAARAQWHVVADQLQERFPKIGKLMTDAEQDVLAHMSFPREHHQQNLFDQSDRTAQRRDQTPYRCSRYLPNEAAIVRLVGALLLEQNDEWALCRRYMSLETLAELGDNPSVSLPAVAD